MITKLELENFRSIHQCELDLTPLTVLIGANGTGKSNVIKALDCIGSTTRNGLSHALNEMGGFLSVVPRFFSRLESKKKDIRINYRVSYRGRSREAFVGDYATVHNLRLGYTPSTSALIKEESLKFEKPLRHLWDTLYKYRAEQGFETSLPLFLEEIGDQHSVQIRSAGATQFALSHSFPETQDSLLFLRDWLGFRFVGDVESGDKLMELFDHIQRPEDDLPRIGQVFEKHSLVDPDIKMPLDFCDQNDDFTRTTQRMRRYDLAIKDLRQEQRTSASGQLGSEGENLPSALQNFVSSRSEHAAVPRLKRTLQELAPHVHGFKVKRLRSAKEFIEFVESTTGRGVESWDASDGTLRGLAVLLALEIQPRNTTITIEEPELNLHPWAVKSIMRHVREIIKENSIQVVLSTHSPQVLELCEPDEVWVAERQLETGTQFTKVSDIAPIGVVEMGEMGRLWTKGLLRGVPTYD